MIWSGWKGGYGYCLQIDHQNGYTTTYGHWAEGEEPYIVSVRLKLSEIDPLAARE